MVELICPKCGSNNVIPAFNDWKHAIEEGAKDKRLLRTGVQMVHDSKCNDCGYVGTMLEKTEEDLDPDMKADLEKAKKELR